MFNNSAMLMEVLKSFGVDGKIENVRSGPVVTIYDFLPAPGIKMSQVIGLADDIARQMAANGCRISQVPGKPYMGIELPNQERKTVRFSNLINWLDYNSGSMALPIALGEDIMGDPVIADLSKMPHLLVGGTTGSGKSVGINTMILSLINRLSPEQCQFVMIDPKMLELSVYNDIPHMLRPVITDPKKAVEALQDVVKEMENRYKLMSSAKVRNIASFNNMIAEAKAEGCVYELTEEVVLEDGSKVYESRELNKPMPYIVVVIDEVADLMMVAGKDVEKAVQRLAQMARAAGIHLIMATQRPSVDVITGTIKANFPSRIAFQVSSAVDSRTILDEQGAEKLLGMGDMLVRLAGREPIRVHGGFASDAEVQKMVDAL